MADTLTTDARPGLLGGLREKWQQTGEGSYREILKVSLPLVASTTSHTLMTFTDRMFLSWYSPEAIAASVPASPLSFTFICFFLYLCLLILDHRTLLTIHN